MVPSYKATPCFLAWLTGLTQSLVPFAKPMKFATPIGALSGKSSHFNLPTVVSMTAVGPVGRGAVTGAVAGLVAGFAAGAVCDQDREVKHINPSRESSFRIDIS